ncbi:MAG: MarR family transcriptional regulator [Anaerolineales bacterium]|nr:MAG: MarR family transcriptional regulator [Anaerolineales bacterium]
MNMSLDPKKSYGYQIRGTHRLFARLLEKSIAGSDIKRGDWYLLRVLWEKDGISQKELSNQTFLTESSVVTMLHSMAKAGLVVRERDKIDKRRMRILLTDKARQLKDDLLPFAREINARAIRNVASEDLDIFMKVLSSMKDNLDDELGTTEPKRDK